MSNDPHERLIRALKKNVYKDKTEDEIKSMIFKDDASFESALKSTYDAMPSNIDYGSFRKKYYERYGSPFEKKKTSSALSLVGSGASEQPAEAPLEAQLPEPPVFDMEKHFYREGEARAKEAAIKEAGDNLNIDGKVDPVEAGEIYRQQHEDAYGYNEKYDMATEERRDFRKLKNVELHLDQLGRQRESAILGLEERFGKDWVDNFDQALNTYDELSKKEKLSPEEETAMQNAFMDLKLFEDDHNFKRLQNAEVGIGESDKKIKEIMGGRWMGEAAIEQKEAETEGMLSYMANKVGKIASRSTLSFLKLPRLVDSLVREKKDKEDWGIWDTWGSMLDEADYQTKKTLTDPSRKTRPVFENVATYDGKQYVLDDKKNITMVRDDRGTDITDQVSQEEIDKFYNSGTEAKHKFTGAAPLFDKAIDVAADFMIMRTAGAGLATQASTTAQALALSRAGVTATAFANISAGAYDEAVKDLELSPDEAAAYAVTTAAIQSVIETMVGNVETAGVSKATIANATRSANNVVRSSVGKLGGAELAKLKWKEAFKIIAPELGEEGMQLVTDNVARVFTNTMAGSNLELADQYDLAETLLLTTIVTAPVAMATNVKSDLANSAYLLAVHKPDKYKQVLDELLSSGTIDAPTAQREKDKIDAMQEVVATLPRNLSTDNMAAVMGLTAKKLDIENMPITKETKKNLTEQIDTEIERLILQEDSGAAARMDATAAASPLVEESPSETPVIPEEVEPVAEPTEQVPPTQPEAPVVEQQEEKPVEQVEETSEKPPKPKTEISKEIRVDSPDAAIADFFLAGGRIKTEHINRYGDRNKTKGTAAIANYGSKDGESIDIMAARIADEFGKDEKEIIEKIIDFIHENPSSPKKAGEAIIEQQKGLEQKVPEEWNKIPEYLDRIEAGESVEEVTKGLPDEIVEEVQSRLQEDKDMGEIESQLDDNEIEAFNNYMEKFEVDGEVDMDALQASWESGKTSFDPEQLDLPEDTYNKIDNLVNQHNERKAQESQEIPEQVSTDKEGVQDEEITEADLISEDIDAALSEFADKKVQTSKTERVAHGKGFLNKPVKVKPTKEQRAKLADAIRTAVEAPTKENKAAARDAFIDIYESPYTGSKQVKAIWKQLTETFPELKEPQVQAVKKPRTAMRARGRKTKVFERLKKSFPNVEVISDPVQVVAAQAASGKTAAAFVWEGKIFVERSAGDLELAEEFAHIWVGLAKHFNSAIYNKGVRDIQKLEEFNDMRSDPDYDNLTDTEVAEEILAKKIAEKGGSLKILPSNLTPSNATIDKIVKTAATEIYGGKAISFATSAEIDKALNKGVAMEISTSSALNPKNTAARKAMRFIDEYFTSGKGLDKIGLRNEIERIVNKKRAIVSEIRIRHQHLQKLINEQPDKELVVRDVALVFNGGKVVTDLPIELQSTMEKLMSLRSEFQEIILDNLVREGKVIMNDDLKMVLTSNYDESLDFESAAQQLEEHYDAEFEKAEALTDPADIEQMYEEYAVKKAELLNKKRELIATEIQAKIDLAKSKGADVPARIAKLNTQLRDIQAAIDKFTAKAMLDPTVTALQDLERKRIDKEIKKLQKELDGITPSALTPTEQILLEDIQNLEDTLSALMETQGVVDKESLLKLIDKVAGIEATLNEQEMSMNETIAIRYKKNGDSYDLVMFQKDGTEHTVNGVSEKEVTLLLGEEQVDVMKNDGEGYVNTPPKIFYNNTMYESVMRGTDYVNRSYMMHDHKDFRNDIVKFIGQTAFDEAVAFLHKKYSDKRMSGVRWDDRPDGVREYTFTNIYGVESSPMEISDPVAFFRKIGLNERQVNAVVNSTGSKYSFRGPKGKYVQTGVEFQLTASQMDNLITQIVSVNEVNRDLKTSGVKVDTGALKRRKNIEPEIRKLMGEYLDPRVNIFRTLIKSALIAEQTRFNRWFLDNGEGIYTSDTPTPQHTKKVTKQEIPTLGDDQTIYVTKEVYDVMWGDDRAMSNGLVKVFTQFSGWTKGMLTVYSPASQARNFWGAFRNMVASGNVAAIPYLAQATRIVSQDFETNKKWYKPDQSWGTLMSSPLFAMRTLVSKNFGYKGNEPLMDAYKEAVEEGLVNSSAEIGELQDAMNLIDEFAVTKGQKAKAAYKKATQVFTKPYQMTDAIFKVAAYMYEKDQYLKAGMDDATARKTAAENVKNMQPTYDRAPKAMRALSRSPIVGNFVLFRAEMFRTTYNTLKIGAKEIKSDNPEIRKIGFRRILSNVLVTSITPALAMYFAHMLGLSGEEEEAIRVQSPEYFENNQFLILELHNGEFAYIDLSFIDPASDFHRAFEAALRGEDIGGKVAGAVKELGGDFFDWDIFLKAAVIDIVKNEDVYGRPIFHENDDRIPMAWDVIKHAADPLIPKGIRDARDFVKRNKDDSVYMLNFRDETLNQVIGMKKKTKDLKVSTYYRLHDLKDEYDSHRKYYRENPKKLKKSMRKMDETFLEMKTLRDAGSKLYDIESVMTGDFDKYNRKSLPKDMIDDLEEGKINDYKLD